MKKKIAIAVIVLALMLFGFYIGVIQASPTLTPGFGASGDWGGYGGETIVVNPPPAPSPVVPPAPVIDPIKIIPDTWGQIQNPVVPTPGFGGSGDWGCGTTTQ